MQLSLRAYDLASEILRVVAVPLPREVRDRIEDIAHDRLIELADDVRDECTDRAEPTYLSHLRSNGSTR
jgi:hypothetical protein